MKKLTGLFLGAGASYEAGMPLVWELTAEIKNWLTPDKLRELNAGWRTQGTGHSDRVIDNLASVLERPAMHYEAVLGYMEVQFRRHHALRNEYHSLYLWLVELVYHLLYVRQVSNDAFFTRHLSAYDGLRTLADANTPLWVFSLNHDVILEAIAARLSIPLRTGFSSVIETFDRRDPAGKKIGDIRAEVLTKHDLEHHAMNFPNPPHPGIYLLKIHGALDIFTFNEGQDLLKLLPNAPGQDRVIDVLRAANEGLFYEIPGAPGARAKALNEICYPDKNGVMQFLRRSLLAGASKFDARGQQVLPKSMLKHFRENLNFVTNLVCIGYGFGDPLTSTKGSILCFRRDYSPAHLAQHPKQMTKSVLLAFQEQGLVTIVLNLRTGAQKRIFAGCGWRQDAGIDTSDRKMIPNFNKSGGVRLHRDGRGFSRRRRLWPDRSCAGRQVTDPFLAKPDHCRERQAGQGQGLQRHTQPR